MRIVFFNFYGEDKEETLIKIDRKEKSRER